MLAIVRSLQEWRHFVEGAEHQVEIWTDHKNLEYFMSAKQLNRWSGPRCPELVAGSRKQVEVMIEAMYEHGNVSTKGHVTRRAAHPITCTPLPFGDVLVASKKLKEKRRERNNLGEPK